MIRYIKGLFKASFLAVMTAFFFLAIVITAVCIWWNHEDEKNFHLEKFDREKWLSVGKVLRKNPDRWIDNFACDRGKMYYELEKQLLKKSSDFNHITSTLGVPFRTVTYKSFFQEKECYVYMLGRCRWVPVPLLLLVCKIGNSNKATYFMTDLNDENLYWKN